MGERLGPPIKVKTNSFAYGLYTPDQVQQIVGAYVRTGSCEAASRAPHAFWSSATVSRVVRKAVAEGVLQPSLKRGTGRPRIDRSLIFRALQDHPDASDLGIARTLGVSEATIYRAKHGT